MRIPDNCRYTKEHEWVRLEGDTAVVGITEFAQAELGDIVFVDLPAPGKKFNQKSTLCVVESTKAASDVYAPIGGEVAEANSALASSPEKINREPYEGGWLVKLKNPAAGEFEKLLTAAQYKDLLGDRA